jgi:hypothetical protein
VKARPQSDRARHRNSSERRRHRKTRPHAAQTPFRGPKTAPPRGKTMMKHRRRPICGFWGFTRAQGRRGKGCTSMSPPRRRTSSETSATSGRHRRLGILPGRAPALSHRDGSISKGIGTQRVGSARCGVVVFRDDGSQRGGLHAPPSTVPSSPTRPERVVSSTDECFLPPGSTRPSPEEAAATNTESLRQGSIVATALPSPSLAPRGISGGLL